VQTHLSLEQIENDFWGYPAPGETHLIGTVHRLRGKPIASLETEDLRIMIAQKVGLEVLMPIALARLEREPLLEGDYYPGDLLVAVLRVAPDYWTTHPAEFETVKRILALVDYPESPIAEGIKDFRERVSE
jgi:CDI immunity proteins